MRKRRAWRRQPAGWSTTDLLAQPLNIHLGQLLAVHQGFDPPVQRRDGGGLEVDRSQLCRHAPDILHVCIHSGNWSCAWKLPGCGTRSMSRFKCADCRARWCRGRVESASNCESRRNDVCVHRYVWCCWSPGAARVQVGVKIGQVGGWAAVALSVAQKGGVALCLG